VRLTPRGGADRIDDTVTDAAGTPRLAVRVRAVPEKGAANESLERLLARTLGVPASAVAVTAGHASRAKTVSVENALLRGRRVVYAAGASRRTRSMRRLILSLTALLAALAMPAQAQVESAYTDLDFEKNCTTFAAPPQDEGGDWANSVCNGYRGYPVFVYYGDARESLFYGFPPGGDLAPSWESFGPFNATTPRIEWRIARTGDLSIPFATIHRWHVSDPEDPQKGVEVLVVEKVGQPHERDGCAVAYVMSTGNPNANEKARRYADEIARDFDCGADQPAIDAGSVPLPDFSR
jgi:uncharacterized protein YggU (UPF0235/DUF167 family)